MSDHVSGFKKAKTVVITVEVEYQNGDKDFLRTTELDASAIIEGHNKREEWNHFFFGLNTDAQYNALLYNYPGATYYYNPSTEYFALDVSLRKSPDSNDDWVYQIQRTEKPTNRAILRLASNGSITMCNSPEQDIAAYANAFPSSHYFFMEVPD